jgi:hypothetical protein
MLKSIEKEIELSFKKKYPSKYGDKQKSQTGKKEKENTVSKAKYKKSNIAIGRTSKTDPWEYFIDNKKGWMAQKWFDVKTNKTIPVDKRKPLQVKSKAGKAKLNKMRNSLKKD